MATKIIDIRVDTAESDILADIKRGLRPDTGGEKKLPTLLLYEYYLTNAEIEVLEKHADKIAEQIPSGSMVVELGSGNLRKVNILLQAIDRLGKDLEYYAVDLSLPELERTFSQIPTGWLKSPAVEAKPKTILWLGSSLGNFKRHEVPPFLAGFGQVLQTCDTMLIGIDSCKDPERVFHAYNDRNGVTHNFILNGLKHANALMGEGTFNVQDWEAIGEYDKEAGRHHAFVAPRKDVVVDGVPVKQGERIRIEESYKYSREEAKELWELSRLVENSVWANSKGDYGLHFVSKPAVFFPTKPEEYAANPVPSLAEWQELWKAWDAVSKQMIPEDELLSKPIELRNECIFYLGHIPTFLDIHLARATDGKPSEPAYFWKIFERGVDPDVEDPTKCHAHSEVPEEWPQLDTILQYQQTVRDKVEALYVSGEAESNGRVSRGLWLGFEHEAMHLETLLYMLIQSDKVLPPPGTKVPDFAAFTTQSEALAVENEWFTIPETNVEIGLDDAQNDSKGKRYFGWDNERPRRSAHVKSFRAKARPITNGEYATYLTQTGRTAIPASWCDKPYSNANGMSATKRDSVINGHQDGINGAAGSVTEGKFVRTVYGTVPLKLAMGWPVVASYDELAGCAQWMGGRIPTLEEARSIYSYVESMKPEFEKSLGNTIPAVNGHLINEGVFETPPSHRVSNGNSGAVPSLNPNDLFIDLKGTNVGFKHWHPVSVVEKGDKLCGQSDLGGVWEWTSTVLEKHDGFEPMELYPGYTAHRPFQSYPNLFQETHLLLNQRPSSTERYRKYHEQQFAVQMGGLPGTEAMFMRLRGHTCTYCMAIDEAHYKRHHDIAEQLRAVYESCGEVDGTIIPSEQDFEDRGRTRGPDNNQGGKFQTGRSITPGDAPSSKRQRKDAKNLARAASRSRVVTQEEIRYVDSVVHSADGITSNDADGPRNTEEIDEIEKQLRYHAHVYNTQGSRKGLKKLAVIFSDTAEVDFDAEMERILEVFRITELLKRNTKTKGLQGKGLKLFLTLVDDFKQAIVEDIVQVKKDAAEVRMRRAGYLRYTNRASYDIVENRYSTKDWKTGEKILSSASGSSGAKTPEEDSDQSPSEEEQKHPIRPGSRHDPDRRHLENIHQRITGDDGLYESTIEPYRAPLLPLPPNPTPGRGPVSLKVISIKAPEMVEAPAQGGGKKKSTPSAAGDWQTVTNDKSLINSAPRLRVWGNIPSQRPAEVLQTVLASRKTVLSTTSFPSPVVRNLSREASPKAPAVQSPSIWASRGPESFVSRQADTLDEHPVVSQRKKSKKLRETKRKANRLSVPANAAEHSPAGDDNEKNDSGATNTTSIEVVSQLDAGAQDAEGGHTPEEADEIRKIDEMPEPTHPTEHDDEVIPSIPPLAPIPVTTYGKQIHWKKFARYFTVDQPTMPLLASWSGCSHGSSCAFEANDIPDCPFHEPHCACVDPVVDQCYLVMPCLEMCSTGPYNRLHGEKLLAMYEEDQRTKGRLMLVDEDMISYLTEDPLSRALYRDPCTVPNRLAKEYTDFADGFDPGPLMKQERQFERLWSRNKLIKRQLTHETLREIQRATFERPGARYICYCAARVPDRGLQFLPEVLPKDFVACSFRNCPICYFHKSCVKKLGVDKVSRWYCTSCEKQMQALGRQTLRDLGYTDIPDEDPHSHPYLSNMQELVRQFEDGLDELLGTPDEFMKLMPIKLQDQIKDLGGLGALSPEVQQELKERISAMCSKGTKRSMAELDL
ncbi:duf323 domain-containing protein [Stemphylium lycopersici]|nr:duf323 domain-containing protein [Stemphylium lycopersici]